MSVQPLLEVAGATTGYGRIEVVHDVDLVAPPGTVVALLGPSGAGKTTLLRAVSGMLPLQAGSVRFAGERIDGRSPDEIAARGLVHVPERGSVFASLTVEENLRLGLEMAPGTHLDERLPAVLDAFPKLGELRHRRAGTLSGGEQQMVALGRAFIAEPRALLLDELSMGLAPQIVDRLYQPLTSMRDEGVTIVLVEQHLDRVLKVADICYVIVSGRVVRVAEPAELSSGGGAATGYFGT